MTTITKGSTVRQIVKPIEGIVDKTVFDEDKQQLRYHVTYTGDDKQPTGIWFTEDQLTVLNTPKQVDDAASAAKTATQGAKS